MKYGMIATAFYGAPWAILPEKWAEIEAFLRVKTRGGEISSESIDEILDARRPELAAAIPGAARRSDGSIQVGRVGIVQCFGVIMQRGSLFDEVSGCVSTERLGAQIDSMVTDKGIRSILLAFDSPGGSVYGISELGEKIRAAREGKRIVAIADSVAASGAYWLASQASEVNVTPGGQVGSIGVIVSHYDYSKALEKEGIRPTLIKSSPYKAETAAEAPLTEEAQTELQATVNHYHEMFAGAVARGRGVTEARVGKEFGQGRMVVARTAVERGMADRVATLEQVLRRLGAYEGGSTATARAQLAEKGGV